MFAIDGQVCQEIPQTLKKEWIIKHCRKAEDEPVGYRADFYKTWMAGRRRELRNFSEEDQSSVDGYLISEKVSEPEVQKPSPFYSFIRKSSYESWKSDVIKSARK